MEEEEEEETHRARRTKSESDAARATLSVFQLYDVVAIISAFLEALMH